MRRLVAAAAVGLMLSGCATGTGDTGAGGTGHAWLVDVPASDPVDLVGLWRVTDADGEGDPAWLRLTPGSYQLWRDCGGFVEGGWEVSSRVFVASAPFASTGSCPVDPWPTAEWLTDARAYRASDGGWELLDASGERLARLTVDGAPEPIPNALPEYAQAPEVTDDVRAAFAGPAPLPAVFSAATAGELVGRWEPAGTGAHGSFVELSADGTWTGSDGCNDAGGAWGVDDGGLLLATSGITTAIGCDGVAVTYWLSAAARAAFDGGVLVLLDVDGAELGRLSRR